MTQTYTLTHSATYTDTGAILYYTHVSESDLDTIRTLAKESFEANRDHSKGSYTFEDVYYEFPMLIKRNPEQTIQLVNVYTFIATYTG
jgi:hypothetical protein